MMRKRIYFSISDLFSSPSLLQSQCTVPNLFMTDLFLLLQPVCKCPIVIYAGFTRISKLRYIYIYNSIAE